MTAAGSGLLQGLQLFGKNIRLSGRVEFGNGVLRWGDAIRRLYPMSGLCWRSDTGRKEL